MGLGRVAHKKPGINFPASIGHKFQRVDLKDSHTLPAIVAGREVMSLKLKQGSCQYYLLIKIRWLRVFASISEQHLPYQLRIKSVIEACVKD
jgi:hypothetical protein